MYMNIFRDEDKIWLWDDNQGMQVLDSSEFQYAYKRDPRGKHMTFTGERCKKVSRFDKNSSDIFESDLPLETRVLSDLYLHEDVPSNGHRLVFFDIEVSCETGFPDSENAVNPITSIALYDDVLKRYTVMVMDVEGIHEDYSTISGNEKLPVDIYFFPHEFDLLSYFLTLWEEINPTIVSGWNSDHFDVPYLYNRMINVLGWSQAKRLSTINKVKYSRYRKKYQIAGISSLDYLDIYKKFTYTELPNYRLGTVGEKELGEEGKKIEYEGSLDDLFKDDIHEFIRYNLRDVEILHGLENKLKLIELIKGICHAGHVPYEDYAYSSRFLEGTIVTYLHRKGLVVTNKNPNAREMMNDKGDDVQFGGAYVKCPLPAQYDWVYSLDLQSLYPSIIMSLNISPETKVGKVVGWDASNWKNTTTGDPVNVTFVPDTSPTQHHSMTPEQLREMCEEGNLCISSNGIVYRTDKTGIIPEILDNWFQSRLEYKQLQKDAGQNGEKDLEQFYNRRQHIQKIFLNSLYGVLGLPIFRFFDLDNALAVTATGQDVIKNSEEFVNELYKNAGAIPRTKAVLEKHWIELKRDAKARKSGKPTYPSADDWGVYIDTDSLYFSSAPLLHNMPSPIPTTDEIEEFTVNLAKYMGNRLNKHYDEMAKLWFNCDTHRFIIKGETVAKSAIWIAKKRYAMLKTYDLETDTSIPEGKLVVKGLDIVRSTFPTLFKEYMKQFIIELLRGRTKAEVDNHMMSFYESVGSAEYPDVARNTAVKNIEKYSDPRHNLGEHSSGAPMHVKSAVNYNMLLKTFELEDHWAPIEEGEKIKYVVLKNNPYHLDVLAFKDFEDPPEIKEFLTKYTDRDAMFNSELKKKLQDFYDAMSWGMLPTDRTVDTDILNMFGL